MLIALHLDDNPAWMENVCGRFKEIAAAKGIQRWELFSRKTVTEAGYVIQGTDRNVLTLVAEKRRRRADGAPEKYDHVDLNVFILDLTIKGGGPDDRQGWRTMLADLRDAVPAPQLRTLDAAALADALPPAALQTALGLCPNLLLGRQAAQGGASVIILTNSEDFLLPKELPVELQQKLLMAAARASDYLWKKKTNWSELLLEALGKVPPLPPAGPRQPRRRP